MNLEELLHVVCGKAQAIPQLGVFLGFHALLQGESIPLGMGPDFLGCCIGTSRDVGDRSLDFRLKDLDGLDHLLDLLIVLVHDLGLLGYLDRGNRLLKLIREVNLHDLKPRCYDVALLPKRVIDLVEHLFGDAVAIAPEVLRDEVLRCIAHHVAGQKEVPLTSSLVATEGEVDLADGFLDKLNLHRARDLDRLAATVWVVGVGTGARGNGRPLRSSVGPLQSRLRRRKGDET
mmetsp:Transcript_60154/g.195173  ORF Transcript_60154/g.195173 Transcript_60154/m.195173 type:complete len:232 (-) Transcript_60154:350-1045(-)